MIGATYGASSNAVETKLWDDLMGAINLGDISAGFVESFGELGLWLDHQGLERVSNYLDAHVSTLTSGVIDASAHDYLRVLGNAIQQDIQNVSNEFSTRFDEIMSAQGAHLTPEATGLLTSLKTGILDEMARTAATIEAGTNAWADTIASVEGTMNGTSTSDWAGTSDADRLFSLVNYGLDNTIDQSNIVASGGADVVINAAKINTGIISQLRQKIANMSWLANADTEFAF